MSSLGDLLLANLKSNKAEDSSNGVGITVVPKIFPERVEKNNVEETQSNASSTDDYVRELLDPDDRPRNVWHVVEGPKVQSDADDESQKNCPKASDQDVDGTPKASDENLELSQGGFQSKQFDEHETDEVLKESVEGEAKRPLEEEITTPDLEHPLHTAKSHERSYKRHRHRETDRSREHDKDSLKNKDREKYRDRSRDRERGHGRDRDRVREKDRGRERDRERERESGRSQNRDKDRLNLENDSDKDHVRRRDRDHKDGRDDYESRHSSSRHRSSRRRHRYSGDDDVDDDDSVIGRRRHHEKRRSHSRSKASSSSKRRERSRSDSHSPITKRNSRTILIMQLNPRADSHDLEDFFNDIGKVKEVRLIMDSKTRRHKGIAYIEFEDTASAQRAMSLNGKKFFDANIVIQSAQTDRNNKNLGEWPSSSSISHTVNQASSSHPSSRSTLPPNCYRVYVGSLHTNLTEDMLRSVFEPFGPIVRLELMRDRQTNLSRGYAFITYANVEDGQDAVQSLDGLELGGKPIKVSKSTDKNDRHSSIDGGGNSRVGHHHHHHHHDSDSDGQSSKTKDVTASLFELAGH